MTSTIEENNISSMNENSKHVIVDNTTTMTKTILPEPLTKLLPPSNIYFLDQIKNGLMISNQKIIKNRLIFGRARDCDIALDHPSISRYHAALLWAPKNDQDFQNGTNNESFWYLIDCGSTHGTVCNKQSVEAGKMIKITPNNNLFQFGASTRLFTLGSNEQSQNSEDSDHDDDEIQNLTLKKPKETNEDLDACTWGISLTDCNDETEESAHSVALKSIIAVMKDGQSTLQSENENAYSDNPYKCLQQWFEREGYDFDYKIDTINNKFKCIFELPIDDQWIPIEGQLMNKKKEAISDACLRCCRLLDQATLLFSWQRKDSERSKVRKEFYDDEDDLLDETVKVNKKFKKDDSTKIDNYNSLHDKWKEINSELCQLKVRLATIGLEPGVTPEIPGNLTDSLDVFMTTLNRKKYGLSMNEKIEKSNLRIKIKHLEQEQSKIEKLIQIAKPVEIILKNSLSKWDSTNKINNNSTSNLMSGEVKTEKKQEDTKTSNYKEKYKNEIDNSILKPDKPLKNYKEIRKLRQDSIIEAIEQEKRLERQQKKSLMVESDANFIDLIPLDNQSGDGRTHLNDKFGY